MLDKMLDLKGKLNAVRDGLYQYIADRISVELQEGNVLDVGTGRGHLPIRIAEKNPRLKAYGVDISPKSIEAARRNAIASGLVNAPLFELGDASHLPFEDELFDVVVSTFSLHHWNDRVAGLDEIFRVTRPGGKAWIFDHWKDPSPQAKVGLRREFGWLAAFFALAHLRFVSSSLTWEEARSLLEDPALKFKHRQLDNHGIFLLLRLEKGELI